MFSYPSCWESWFVSFSLPLLISPPVFLGGGNGMESGCLDSRSLCLAVAHPRLLQNAMTHIDNQKPKIVETLTATLPIARWTGILRGGGGQEVF